MSLDPLRVWAGPLPHIDISDRATRLGLNPIVRAGLDDRMTADDHSARYGSLITHYEVAESPEEAELAIYPHIVESRDRADFTRFLKDSEKRHLRTLVFGGNDLEPIMPSESVILLHPGPTRGAQPHADALALPYFFTDRAAGNWSRGDGARPAVAFCGQGQAHLLAGAGQLVVRGALRLRNQITPQVIPPPVSGHVRLRSTALERLRWHPGVDEHFVVRDQYRAGATTEFVRESTQREFDENLRSATYALCVRGTGNFSARFYEALSFGRVPLFVDTRCVLPLEHLIDWRSRTVWIDAGDVESIGERLVESHPSVLADPLRSADSLRDLWETHLTQHGFFQHLPALIRGLL